MGTRNTHSSNVLLEKNLSKYKVFSGQMRIVYKAFSERPKTTKWKKQNKIELVKFGICPISKHRAGFYTGKEMWNGSN